MMPEGCEVLDQGTFPLFMHRGTPFTEVEVSTNGGKARTSMVVDTGWSGCNALDPSLAEELGLKQADSAPCSGAGAGTVVAGYQGVSFGPWHGWDVVPHDMSGTEELPRHPRQRGAIASGTLVNNMAEFDLGPDGSAPGMLRLFYRGDINVCAEPRRQLEQCQARWAGLSMEEIPLRFYGSCITGESRGEDVKNRSVIPTITAAVSGVEGLLQLDTGRDTSNGRVDVSVNEAYAEKIRARIPLKQRGPETAAHGKPGCFESAWEPEDASERLELRMGSKVIALEQLVVRKGTCQTPYDGSEPAGLMGMSVLGQARRFVLDPHSRTLLMQWRTPGPEPLTTPP
ncbi:hypothetical protein D7V88_03825 [Corallococcus terminator]|uniref:Uncharacterized protein n=1 Tax=Corallococcus terminator TaxID=2316733 RepID=A0A3A8JB51_9BACT|nr:hypothetical protein D7V88_03825 [Corallococcus terminator]